LRLFRPQEVAQPLLNPRNMSREEDDHKPSMDDPLLQSGQRSDGTGNLSGTGIIRRFMYFAVCFSVNHGCVTSVVGLASSVLPKKLAGTQLGTLYIVYSLTALFASAALVTTFGTKWSLFVSTSLYCTYVACFLLTNFDDETLKWTFALIGAIIGGIAAGNLWTAQGAYFGETVKAYSRATGEPTTAGTGKLAGYFATVYLLFECLLKLVTPAIKKSGGSNTLLFIIYSIISVTSASGMMFITDFSDKSEKKKNWSDACSSKKAAGAIKLLVSDPRMPLLYPVCATFGVLASFLNYYVNGEIVTATFGKTDGPVLVGYLGATVTAVAAICSFAFSFISNEYGKGMLLVLGQLCFFGEAFFCLVFTNEQIGNYLPLFVLYTVHGVGRAIYESTTRAVFADIWSSKDVQPFAFANIIISNGMVSAVMFFIDPYLSKGAMCGVGIGSAVCGILGYYFAQKYDSQEFRETVVIKEDVE